MQRKVETLEHRAAQLQEEIAGLETRRDEVRADLVRYERPTTDIVRAEDVKPRRRTIKVERE